MGMEVIINSPAKINLHLNVGNIRTDGFHELVSIFQSVSLFDILSIRSLKTNNLCTLKCNLDFPQEDNLVYKAAVLFMKETKNQDGIEISLEKNIPMGAGLGGGSSNAASVLLGLNKMFNNVLNLGELSKIGAKLGSDVPFFINASTGLVKGRGEVVLPIKTRGDFFIVLVNPGFSVSTKEAFDLLDFF